MEVSELLSGHRRAVVDEAFASLDRSHEVHYQRSGQEFTEAALSELFDLVVTALQTRELGPVSTYCETIAEERFRAGFGISEVQTAFNALEVAMWNQIVAGVPPAELAEAVGLLSTILGHGKDALARRYVSLASARHVPTLDLSALFSGIEA